jgi:hypothetical protein
MSTRRRKKLALPDSLQGIDELTQKLALQKSLLYGKLMSSDNVDDIMKAVQYSQTQVKNTDQRAFIFAPDSEFYTGMGYKPPVKNVPFEFLRAMAGTPFIRSVIGTRVDQVLNFANFSTDNDREGWTIRKKVSRFDKDYKNTDQDKRIIEKIADFVENGGKNAKFTLHDDFYDFLKTFPKDLLELDQGCFEIQRTRGGEVLNYDSIDSATIRLLETIDPHYDDKDKYEELNFKGDSYLPTYCQVWRERLLINPKTKEPVIWYPWELAFVVRNKSTNILQNGYGQSELEVLIRIVTWMLETLEYNGRFFSNGSNPKGFFTMKGAVDTRMLNDFRMAWRSMMTGWQNAHKIPIFENEKIEWVDMQMSNKEMEFSQWFELLTLIACAVYRMDPSEMGFRFKQQNTMFGEGGQKERLNHSKDKGLKPLLMVIQKAVDKYIVSELNPGYQFVFTGIDIEDETTKLDNDVKKLANGMVSMTDKFKEYTGRPFDPKKDIILNAVYNQQKMQSMYGGAGMNGQVDDEMGGKEVGAQNPFDEFAESVDGNPIMSEVSKYVNKLFEK